MRRGPLTVSWLHEGLPHCRAHSWCECFLLCCGSKELLRYLETIAEELSRTGAQERECNSRVPSCLYGIAARILSSPSLLGLDCEHDAHRTQSSLPALRSR